MDVATVLTLVQTLLQLLDSPISREIESLWGYNSQLQNLRNTMSTILAVLFNVERLQSQQLPISIPQVTLERLQDAVYQADDLLDEAATVSHLKQLMPGYKLTKEIRLFFSRFNQLHYAFTKSSQITNLRQILDDIAHDHRDFIGAMIQPSHVEVSNNINSSSRETHSFLCEEDMIIGRDEDKQILKDMLLDTAVAETTVSVVSIVGIGGLGKTALAKLLYNDLDIRADFDVMMWVCVSDDFDVKSLLAKILAEATDEPSNSGLSKQQLHIRLRQQLERKKYLLVLDDVWNENHVKNWNELRNILDQGRSGSRIIVTTRSLKVAELAKSHLTHELKGLSDDDSWELFKKETQILGPHLDEIGKEIVDKCSNVPLAIRFVASLLQGQSDRVWHSLKNTDLAHITKQDDDGNDDGILPVLKISYNHLPPHLKSCFSYCAVYPKDYKIHKMDLIYQWMAHGFIKSSSNNGLSLEDLGENYFMKLLQRCFFQDVVQDEITGEIRSCKMHDLVHDLAREVAGTRVVLASYNDSWSHDDKTRHVFIDETYFGECHLTNLKNLRTFLAPNNFRFQILCDLHFPTNLRVLNLSITKLKAAVVNPEKMQRMSSMVGKFLHLRYLDVSSNLYIVSLPDFITQLHNLQALNLRDCICLEELPKDLSKLVNLRHLDIIECNRLRHMARGMNRMTCLHKLTRFVVNNKQGEEDIGKLEDLKDLNNLRDDIQIMVKDGRKCDGEQVMINKPMLSQIEIRWDNLAFVHSVDDADAMLQRLQPHTNIKTLKIYGYPGVRLPRFINTPLPNLVKLTLDYCSNLEEIPAWIGCLSSLQLLRMVECKGVKSLPDEMRHLTCLTHLMLVKSSTQLKERCKKPNGDDWPKIKHIPNVSFQSRTAKDIISALMNRLKITM